GLRGAFKVGGNSSLRAHCRQHFDVYEKYCKDKGLEIRDSAMPPADLKKKKEAAEAAEAK
ncbi:hypothetical protein BDZ89DRAFT_919698, partial [Hymenopellis radicata]